MDNSKIICIDLETTGLLYEDEILQISIIDANQKVLLNEYIKPKTKTSWESAMAINHITPEMVQGELTIDAYKDKILEIIKDANLVIGYNHKRFDMPFLEKSLNTKIECELYDVMLEFTDKFAMKGSGNFKLTEACNVMGIDIENAHNSLGDTNATVKLYLAMQEEIKKAKAYIVYVVGEKKFFKADVANEFWKQLGIKDIKTEKKYLVNGNILDNIDEKQYWLKHSFPKANRSDR